MNMNVRPPSCDCGGYASISCPVHGPEVEEMERIEKTKLLPFEPSKDELEEETV